MKKFKKLLALILVFCMAFQVIPVSAVGEHSNHWATKSIDLLLNKGIIVGGINGSVNPDNLIIRAEFVTIINKTFSFIEKSDANFSDVENGKWYADQFSTAKKNGYMVGDQSGNANPEENITRAEVAVILAKVLNLNAKNDSSNFTDNSSLPTWASKSIISMQENKLINGYLDGTFKAGANITRAEAFTIIANIINAGLSDSSKIVKDNPNPNPDAKGKLEFSTTPGGSGGTGGTGGSGGTSQPINYPLRIQANNGGTITVDNSGNHASGTKISIVATPNAGYQFDSWISSSGGTFENINSANTTFTMPASAVTLTANFKATGNTNQLSINVLTSFPSGNTSQNSIDVTYMVTPANAISEVYYSINNGAEEYIYLAGGNGITPKGTLGTGRVFLIPGENNIVFTVKDTAGKTANFNVINKPNYNFSTLPGYDKNYIVDFPDGSGRKYVTNRIRVGIKIGVTKSQVETAATTIGGTIAGYSLGMYKIQVPVNDHTGLKALCSSLMTNYPDLFSYALLDTFDNVTTQTAPAPAPPTDDPWWTNDQWGLNAISIPKAWTNYSGYLRNIKTGVVDGGFRTTHEDLNIPTQNVFNSNIAYENLSTTLNFKLYFFYVLV